MKKIFTLFFALVMACAGSAQTYYNWDFTPTTPVAFPTGFVTWNLDGQAVSANLTGSIAALSSTSGWIHDVTDFQEGLAVTGTYFDNASLASDRWLVTPDIDVPSGVPNVGLVWFAESLGPIVVGNYYDNYQVKVSTTDSNTTSFTTNLATIIAEGGSNHALSLAAFAGQRIRIAFRDSTVNGVGLIMTHIKVINLPANAIAVNDVQIYEHNYLGNPVPITGTMTNTGLDTINSFTLNYSVNGAAPVTSPVTGAGLLSQQGYYYNHPTVFNPTQAGTYNLKVWLSQLNGSSVNSDTVSTSLLFYPQVSGLRKNVLVEEFTGAWCGYCPGGALAMNDLEAAYPYAVPVAIHDQAGGSTADDAMQIPAGLTISNLYNSGFPSAMVDREYLYDNQAIALGFNLYSGPSVTVQDTATAFRYIQATPANVSLTDLTYDSTVTTNNLSVTVNATFLDSLYTGDYRLNLIIVEDSINNTGAGYNQHNYYSAAGDNVDAGNSPLNALPAVIINNGQVNGWTHMHVLRAMAGGAWGTASIIPSTPAAGATYSNTYTTTISPSWRTKFIKIIGVVQEYTSSDINRRTILNVTETRLLASPNAIKEISQFNSLSVYPNPAATMANVEMDLKENAMVNVSVVNILGQTVVNAQDNLLNAGMHTVKVPVSSLNAGLYFVKVVVNGQTSTVPLSVTAK